MYIKRICAKCLLWNQRTHEAISKLLNKAYSKLWFGIFKSFVRISLVNLGQSLFLHFNIFRIHMGQIALQLAGHFYNLEFLIPGENGTGNYQVPVVMMTLYETYFIICMNRIALCVQVLHHMHSLEVINCVYGRTGKARWEKWYENYFIMSMRSIAY